MMALKRRWWLRGKMNQLLPANIQLQLDLDVVSDQYYLKEFTEGIDNYQHCHEEFFDYFLDPKPVDLSACLTQYTSQKDTKITSVYIFI